MPPAMIRPGTRACRQNRSMATSAVPISANNFGRMDLLVKSARNSRSACRALCERPTKALQMLLHVGQHDAPEDDVRRPRSSSERKDVARPALLVHPLDDALETHPTLVDLLGGIVVRHRGVLERVHRIDVVCWLPLKLERFFPGQRAGDEAGLTS